MRGVVGSTVVAQPVVDSVMSAAYVSFLAARGGAGANCARDRFALLADYLQTPATR